MTYYKMHEIARKAARLKNADEKTVQIEEVLRTMSMICNYTVIVKRYDLKELIKHAKQEFTEHPEIAEILKKCHKHQSQNKIL